MVLIYVYRMSIFSCTRGRGFQPTSAFKISPATQQKVFLWWTEKLTVTRGHFKTHTYSSNICSLTEGIDLAQEHRLNGGCYYLVFRAGVVSMYAAHVLSAGTHERLNQLPWHLLPHSSGNCTELAVQPSVLWPFSFFMNSLPGSANAKWI